ncbi:MAG: ATP-binding cassette domain-containing protein [Bilophila sp.]
MTTGAPLTPASDSVPLVRLHHICKRFGTVQANQDISLDIRATQIKALLGENGAGKSTLMAILAGKSQQDSGTIEIDGQLVAFRSPKDALKAGIGMVYQHFMLVDSMTVAENIFLGQRGGLCGWLNPASINERVTQLAAQYGLNIDPRASIRDLSMGERQRVEIMKLLFRDSRVLILDEPTAVLTPPERARPLSLSVTRCRKCLILHMKCPFYAKGALWIRSGVKKCRTNENWLRG